MFIDECRQTSSQKASVLDTILQKAYDSDIPIGGVLVIGSMGHT